jgi:hypothetical protein
MNLDWVKVPKNKEEEKEQFDKLYHMLVRLSEAGKEESPVAASSVVSASSVPMDEFTRLKMDILANFRGDGTGSIPPLEVCKGCDHSFYSNDALTRHFQQAPACREWVHRGLTQKTEMDMPFFSVVEQGLSTLLGSTSKTCRFCQKPISNRKAQEKHYLQAPICNRLAHDTFQSWFRDRELSSVTASSE